MLPLALKGWKPVEQLSPWRPELKDLLRFLLSNAIISMGDSIPAALASHGQLSCLSPPEDRSQLPGGLEQISSILLLTRLPNVSITHHL